MIHANELLRGEADKARAAIPVLAGMLDTLTKLDLPDPCDYARNLHVDALHAVDNLLGHAYGVIGRIAMQDAEGPAGCPVCGLGKDGDHPVEPCDPTIDRCGHTVGLIGPCVRDCRHVARNTSMHLTAGGTEFTHSGKVGLGRVGSDMEAPR